MEVEDTGYRVINDCPSREDGRFGRVTGFVSRSPTGSRYNVRGKVVGFLCVGFKLPQKREPWVSES